MKLGRPFKNLTFSEYFAFIPMHESFSDWNTLGLYRSIIETAKLTMDEKIKVCDFAHTFFQKQFDFLQLKDPLTYLAIISLGQELTKADEHQMWENVKKNQQKILTAKRIKHRNFGTYSLHDCGVENCVYSGMMVRQGSILCESKIRFDSDKSQVSGLIKSERTKKERKNRRQIIEENLEDQENMAGPIIQLRASRFEQNEQAKVLQMLERNVIFEVKEAAKYEFHFKKGKTFGLNLKENSCLFLLDISDEDNESDDLELQDIAEKLNDKPVAFIGIAAMCNDKIDHYLLAKAALEINKIVGGLIDLNGKIVPFSNKNERGKFVDATPEEIRNYVNQINGKIYEIRYEIDYEQTNYCHICDAEWLQSWMRHSDFRLIK